MVAAHLRAQNAGITFTRSEDAVLIEAFELLPTNKAVFEKKSGLRRDFPASAVLIALKTLEATSFLSHLAQSLATMTTQEVLAMPPVVQKAQQTKVEVRDTTDPGIITRLIMRLVGEMGTAIQPTCILKRTKDDVSFRDARIPFRRSCLWLFVRVILHMHFDRATSRPTVIPPLYKLFGLFQLTSVLLHSPVLNSGCFYLCRHGPKDMAILSEACLYIYRIAWHYVRVASSASRVARMCGGENALSGSLAHIQTTI